MRKRKEINFAQQGTAVLNDQGGKRERERENTVAVRGQQRPET
jgi:hypothetical protein